MRNQKKASGKAAPHTPNVEDQFRQIAAAYGTDDPFEIQLLIIMRYLQMLAECQLPHSKIAVLNMHSNNFNTVVQYNEFEKQQFEKDRTETPERVLLVREVKV